MQVKKGKEAKHFEIERDFYTFVFELPMQISFFLH